MLDPNEAISWGLQHLQFDDIVAIATIILASVLYQTSGILWNRQDPYHYKLFEKPQQNASCRGTEKKSRDLPQLLEAEGKDIAILWASQSGTGERFAGRLAKELRGLFDAKVLVVDISDVESASISKLSESNLAIFIASTFGEGDPSDNMHDCWAWLHQLPEGACSSLRFLAFGLGNSNYRYYNAVIDEVARYLQTSGANLLLPVGRADDAHGETEEHFLVWKKEVFKFFKTSLGYHEREMPYEPTFSITEDGSLTSSELNTGAPVKRKLAAGESEIGILPIVKSRELLLHNNSDRGCLHLEFDLTKTPQLKYKTGDYLDIWPINPSMEVQRLLRALGLEEKQTASIRIRSLELAEPKVPSTLTYSTLLRNHLEICAPVSRENVMVLAGFAPDKAARDFLMQMSCDKDTYAQYLQNNYINLGILLENACRVPGAWNSLPLSLVLEILPAMRTRSYSISSSSVVQARQVAITVATAGASVGAAAIKAPGIATNYLTYAKDGNHPRKLEYTPLNSDETLLSRSVRCSLRRSNFKLPGMASAPILMVGAGTGVAPFRAFVQERARLATMGRAVGTTKLIFGCRNTTDDQIYADEFAEWSKQLGQAFTMDLAFSRPMDSFSKRYVQDVVRDQAELVFKLLVDENAHFYICGSAGMARGVSEAVIDIIGTRKNWDAAQIKEFVDQQKRQKRWLQDAWG